MFSSFDCSLMYLRNGVEDPINSISAGFLTGGALAIRSGPRVALGSAMFGGVILGLIEGMQIGIGKMMHEQASPEVRPPCNRRATITAQRRPPPLAAPARGKLARWS